MARLTWHLCAVVLCTTLSTAVCIPSATKHRATPLLDISARRCRTPSHDAGAPPLDAVDPYNTSLRAFGQLPSRSRASLEAVAAWTPRSVQGVDWDTVGNFRHYCASHRLPDLQAYWRSTPYVMAMRDAAFESPDALYDCQKRLVFPRMCKCCDEPRGAAHTADTVHHARLVVVSSKWAFQMYHFLIEVLPRLLVALQAVPDAPVALVPDGPRYVGEYLSLLNISHVVAAKNTTYTADVMYVPSFVSCGHPLPEHVDILRAAVLGALSSQTAPTNDTHIVVIKRKRNRSVTNHDAMMTALRASLPSESFLEATLEAMPVVHQIGVFVHAKAVVAPHGAGLVNTVFAPPTAPVVEFVPQNYDNGCFCHIARVMNRPWWGVLVPDAGDHDTMTVDVEAVVATVRAALA